MKNEIIEIKVLTSDIIDNVDSYFENSYEWVFFQYSDISEYDIDFLKDQIPEAKRKFLKLESVQDQFEYDAIRTIESAYIQSMESNLVKKIDGYIEETITDNLPLDYVSYQAYFDNDEESKTLAFSDYIIVKFKRLDYVKFQRSRNYSDRLYNTFEEEVINYIMDNKRRFSYDNLDASYNWDSNETLKSLWNDYNETIPAINSLIQAKRDKLKTLIKNHVSIFKRESILESIA